MKLQMHSIRFIADQSLITFIQKKADKLDRFFDRIIDGEVFMRLDKDNNMENKIIEIKLNIPRNQLFAKERAKSFEEASDLAVEALKKQIIKHKDKITAH
ncbi:MAG: ribosome-associated translation inhibitor RaiA [Cyclobacteriaceae bacterium]|jgi:putative sigma-54 modulation protein|nr:ribosome-associated translation inhibitor RaiA [Cyclobacteriaceae bacterium]